MEPKQTALAFVDAINSHKTEDIITLMAENHIFVDTYGNTDGWPCYFNWFPDYHIEISEIFESILGFASGTYSDNHWRLPAAWKVQVQNHKVSLCDSKIPYDIMGKA